MRVRVGAKRVLRNQPNVPMKSFFLICAAFALCVCSGVWQLHGSSAPAPTATATVQLSNGKTITFTDFSNQIGVQPHEYVNITVQFASALAGQPVIIEALDGGATSFGSSIPVIDAGGSISFGFLAPNKTGLNSVGLRIGATTVHLQFSVLKAN
jgi:hypothetical protein